jgi:hypothetical protein
VPLTRYQGGGPEAVLEPLKEHLKDYHQLMIQYYGAGVQACYRGPRLFDSEETRVMVKETLDWFKKYRDVLNADMVQLRRPDGRDWDGFLHVNPGGKHKGFVMLYNPTKEIMQRKISLPLYYTGISKMANLTSKEGKKKAILLSPTKDITLDFTIAPDSYTWYLIE